MSTAELWPLLFWQERALPNNPFGYRNILRRWPDFDDARAALALALWELGKRGEAGNWYKTKCANLTLCACCSAVSSFLDG